MEKTIQESDSVTITAPDLYFGFAPRGAAWKVPAAFLVLNLAGLIIGTAIYPGSHELFFLMSILPGIFFTILLLASFSSGARTPARTKPWEQAMRTHVMQVQKFVEYSYGVEFTFDQMLRFWEGRVVVDQDRNQEFQLDGFKIHRERGEFGEPANPVHLVLNARERGEENFRPVALAG